MSCCNDPLISVIVPVYKVEKYLDQCVSSIVEQTYRNLEIILIDDGSPDNCPAMCDAWAEKDTRVRVIHQQNAGVSAARNAGLDAMNGELLMFVDSDDWLDVHMLARMYEKMCEYHADVVACSHSTVADDGTVIGCSDDGAAVYPTARAVRDAVFCRGERAFGMHIGVFSTGILFNRAIFPQEMRFAVGYTHEDAIILVPSMLRANCYVRINDVGYYYRINPDSIMHAGFKMSSFLSFVNEPEEWEKAVRAAGALEYLPYVEERYCTRAAYGYRMSAKESSQITAEERKQLRKTYVVTARKHLKVFYGSEAWKCRSRSRRMSMLLFVLCPPVYAWLYRRLRGRMD